MSTYFNIKNQAILNPPANTALGNATNQYETIYVESNLVVANTTFTSGSLVSPKISQIVYPGDDTAASTLGNQTITLNGSGFAAGASVFVDSTVVGVVSVVSSSVITFISPAKATGSYALYVVNSDGGTAIAVPGIQYSGTPTWSTAAGSLGSYTETVAIANTVTATGDAPISYSLQSGSLPTGSTLNSANGYISGTSPLSASPTTYTFTVRATDAEQQDTDRSFSLTVNPDVVTWSSPANNFTVGGNVNQALSNVTLSATASSGQTVSYTANTLPAGLTLTSGVISGTPSTAGNSTSLLTATAAVTGKSATQLLNFAIANPSIPVSFLVVAGGGGAKNSGSGGGGGGAGGLIETTANVTASSLTVTIGAGGTGGNPIGTNGANTTVTGTGTNLVAIGGGRGGWYNNTGYPGADGGSGGGGGSSGGNGGGSGGAGLQPASASGGFGNAGGNGGSYETASGGGAGGSGTLSGTAPGRSVTVPGYGAVTYAAALQYSGGATNTGQGSGYTASPSYNGGSGIVFIWYPDTYPAASATTGSPTVTTSGGFRVYRFTSSGSITF